MRVRRIVIPSLIAVAVVFAATPASAHLDPDPTAIQAGTTAAVAFVVEHGCAGSDTVGLDIKLPAGVTDVAAEGPSGWTATVADGVVKFAGGTLPATEEGRFTLTLTAPATAGDLAFPAVQTCVKGTLEWLDVAVEGQAEPEHPQPVLKVTAGPPTAADLTPDAPATDGMTMDSGGTKAPGETVAPGASVMLTSASDDASNRDGDSNTGLVVGVIAALVVVAGGLAMISRRGKSKSST